MTTMDSDSESQDSDDGRRFRFEATRKDATTAVHLGTRSNDTSPRQKPEQKSEEEYKDYREKRDGSSYTKHESKRDRGSSKERDNSNAKEHRHSLKYARYSHEPKTSRHEEGTKEHARNSDRLISKHKTRDSKRHGHGRDRSEHRKQRSQERSDNRSQERSSADRNRNKSHERYKHRSVERNRERSTSYQTEKSKSSAEYARPREEEKDARESYKRISMKENEHRKEYVLAKHTDQSEKRADSEPLRTTASNKLDKSEVEKSQGYPELDLSEFDVLSETDENFSDRSEIRGRGSPPGRYRKRNSRKRERGEEGSFERDGTNNSDRQRSGDRHKVNARRNDRMSRSSGSNASTVSDLVLSPSPPVTSAIKEEYTNDHRKRMKRKPSKEPFDLELDIDVDTEGTEIYEDKDSPTAGDGCCCSRGATTDSLPSFDDTSEPVLYGPALPPQLVKPNKRLEEKTEHANLIGPCLPETEEGNNVFTTNADSNSSMCPGDNSGTEDRRSTRSDDDDRDRDHDHDHDHDHDIDNNHDDDNNDNNDNNDNAVDPISGEATDDSTDLAFGPALPPHLLHKREHVAREKIIGPMLPSSFECNEDGGPQKGHVDSEDEDAIGPLPADHPSLRNNYVYEQLEQRARRIMEKRMEEENSVLSQREEWMTELPPAQANNLGLSSRKFRARPGPDMSDRSCWTDTPVQKAEKQRKREEERSHRQHVSEAEHESRSTVSEAGRSKKKEKSLLEMHQNKLRKKKKKEEKEAKLTGGSTRRPFDRDIDLKANQFDQVQKKAIFMKAQLLDERFSRGQI